MTFPIDTTAHDEADLPAPDDYQADAAADRTRGIAALHALADWLSAHPGVPLPCIVTAHAQLHGGPGAQLEQRLDRIAAFAVAHDATREQAGSTVYATVHLVDTAGLHIRYTMATDVGVPL